MKVLVKDFQPFSLTEVEIEGLTVIVGPSNIGKSAFIRAIASALFGRSGDDFVRLGARTSQVEVYDAPSVVDGSIDVVWTKGGGTNRFTVNGVLLDKVGTEVPTNLQTAGYKDIKIGDEWIRPQVSDQFDRLFLLDRPGTFANDVISQATRLSVLLRADKSCSGDLKRQSSLLKIRKSDLQTAQERLAALVDIPALNTRVGERKKTLIDLQQHRRRLDNIIDLVNRRRLLTDLLSSKLPAKPAISASFGEKEKEISALLKLKQGLSQLLSTRLPQTVTAPLDLGLKVRALQALIRMRKSIKAWPDLPPPRVIDLDKLQKVKEIYYDLQQLTILREHYLESLYHAEVATRSVDEDGAVITADLELALSSMDVCPVCNRPMAEITA